MGTYGKPWSPKPINQSERFHDWDLDLADLRLEQFQACKRFGLNSDERVLVGFVDGAGRIYPRERALLVIERLLSFYSSITDANIEAINEKIEGY